LTNGSNPILCRTCPCGYYGLFAFVSRSIDSPSGTPNYCYEPSISVAPYEVIDGKIQFTGDMGVDWSGCIEINVQQDSKGRVGYVKGCSDSWEECVEWDEQTGDCTQTETIYMGCAEIEVYRIGRCYDDLNEFKEFVYSKCPEITPPYPDLWQTWYGRKYTSEAASDCIYQNWDVNNDDSWYAYAYFRYIPKATFHWIRYDCNLRVDTNTQIGHEEETGRYYWCDGECREYGDYGCVECDGTLQEEIMYDWVFDANAHTIQIPAWGGSDVWTSTWGDCTRENWEPECKCIDFYNESSAAAFEGLNDEVEGYFEDESEYWIGEETRTNGTCFDKSYSSKFEPNECWASWWIEGINRKWCYYGTLKIEKWNEKVEYDGLKLRVYAIQKNGNSQGGGSHPLSVDHTQTVLYDTEIDVNWDEEFTFPIVNNMVGFSIYDAGHCVNYGDYSTIRFFPYDSACEYCSTVEIHIQVIGVI